MQTVEAIISLMFFMAAAGYLIGAMEPASTDDALYRLHLAEDAWRVLYLRGDLRDFGPLARAGIERDMDSMGVETGLCYFIKGEQFTNCRGEPMNEDPVIKIRRTVISGGLPQSVEFSIYEPA